MPDPTRNVAVPNRANTFVSFDPIEIRRPPLLLPFPRPKPMSMQELDMAATAAASSQTRPSPWGLVTRFFLPWTEKTARYQSGDYYTEKMAKHPAVVSNNASVAAALESACKINCDPDLTGRVSNDLGKNSLLGNVKDFGATIVGFATFGLLGKDPYYGVIGSFGSRSSWKTSDVDCAAGKATVEMNLVNSMSAESLTRYGYSSPDDTILGNDPLGGSGPLGTMNQSWSWQESVAFQANPACIDTLK